MRFSRVRSRISFKNYSIGRGNFNAPAYFLTHSFPEAEATAAILVKVRRDGPARFEPAFNNSHSAARLFPCIDNCQDSN